MSPLKPRGVAARRVRHMADLIARGASADVLVGNVPLTPAVPAEPKPPPPSPSAEDEAWNAAHAKACKLFGAGAVVGRNPHDGSVHVGRRRFAKWEIFGAGPTWDAAFADAKPMDGKVPGGHG